jgi:hypothetical protein
MDSYPGQIDFSWYFLLCWGPIYIGGILIGTRQLHARTHAALLSVSLPQPALGDWARRYVRRRTGLDELTDCVCAGVDCRAVVAQNMYTDLIQSGRTAGSSERGNGCVPFSCSPQPSRTLRCWNCGESYCIVTNSFSSRCICVVLYRSPLGAVVIVG